MRNVWPFFLSLLLVGCNATISMDNATPTLTPVPFYTATLAPTATPRETSTLVATPVPPTISPLEGTVGTQINIRSAPGQDAPAIGLLNAGMKVQVVGRDADGNWWQIVTDQSPNGTGWVTAAYVSGVEKDAVPVVDVPVAATALPPGVTAPPPATATPAAKTAVTTQMINVRAGPGTTFDALGMLQPNTPVTLTGRNETNTWIQVEYPAGTGQNGWVAALYLKIEVGLDGLPYYDNQGKLKGIPTPAATFGPSPTATIVSAAAPDQDSREKPAASVAFSPDGTRVFTYTSDVSSPTGDGDDWISFVPYSPNPGQATYVYISLKCTGNGNITPELRMDGALVADFQGFACGNYDVAVRVLGGKTYTLGLKADGSAVDLRYVRYDLTIQMAP